MAYLVFANFCLWLYYTFEVPKSALSQVEQDFYGLKTWVYLQRIILPCCIFFRWVNSSVRCVGSTAAYLEAEESYMTGLLHKGKIHVGDLCEPAIYDSLPWAYVMCNWAQILL